MAQLPRPRLLIGGISAEPFIVTHGIEKAGVVTDATRKYRAQGDFEKCAKQLGYVKEAVSLPVLERLGELAVLVDKMLGGRYVSQPELAKIEPELAKIVRDPLVVDFVKNARARGLVAKEEQ